MTPNNTLTYKDNKIGSDTNVAHNPHNNIKSQIELLRAT